MAKKRRKSVIERIIKKMLPIAKVGSIIMILISNYSDKSETSNLVIQFPITIAVKNSSKKKRD